MSTSGSQPVPRTSPVQNITVPEDEPGLNLGRIKGIVVRGRWWILLATCVCAISATAVAYLLPVRFTSDATLLVVQQQVPQRYVTPTSTLTIAEELQAMTQEVLSRKRLLQLIDQFGLYSNERKRLAPEQLIALMRKYIQIQPVEAAIGSGSGKDISSFKISFSADKAILAQEVTSQLTSLFIQENLKVREDQAATTTSFLDEHVGEAKKRLDEQEQRVRDFKMQYLGELPEEQQNNLAILNSSQTQLQNTTVNLDRARQQQVYLQSLLDEYQRLAARGSALPAAPGAAPQATAVLDPVQLLENDLTRLESTRTQLLTIYHERYPDVAAIEREITSKKALLEKLRAAKSETSASSAQSAGKSGAVDPGRTDAKRNVPADQGENATIAQLRSQLEANRIEIENLTRAQKQENDAIAEYRNRLNLTPVREQQLSSISRDYELSKQEYLDLLGKEQQSELAMSLEKRQGGQQFRVAESPSLPTLPSSPKRLKISLGGVGGGIVFGLLLAVLADLRNPKVYDEKEAIRQFSIPLVVALPLLSTPAEIRSQRWKRAFGWFSAGVLTAAVLLVEYYVYRHP